MAKQNEWVVWKTIKLGTGLRTADDFRRAIKDSGGRVSIWGNDILGRIAFTMATEETEVDLIVVSATELGFKDGAARRKDIYERALQRGLQRCPAEVGPQLRWQYQEQPMGERLFVGMEPISDSYGCLSAFIVAHNDGCLWLSGSGSRPDSFWIGDDRWVFWMPS